MFRCEQELAQQLSEAQELLAQSRAADRVRSEETSTAAAAGAELQAAHEVRIELLTGCLTGLLLRHSHMRGSVHSYHT